MQVKASDSNAATLEVERKSEDRSEPGQMRAGLMRARIPAGSFEIASPAITDVLLARILF